MDVHHSDDFPHISGRLRMFTDPPSQGCEGNVRNTDAIQSRRALLDLRHAGDPWGGFPAISTND